MARANDFGGVALCPGREELAAFERGQLPLERLEAIAEHLERCAQCESSLEELRDEDTVQQHLRHPPSEGLRLDESLCLRLEDRARAIAQEQVEPPTVTDGGAQVRAEFRLPLSFGTHLLLEQLEPGGMGIVFKARQETLKRVVALKVIRAATFASADAQARFRREGEALARVRHANVVQIYEFGECQGQPFYTMEWLDGGTLKERLDGRPLPEREAAQLLRTLARAVQALHDERIIHRDLKPGNILFAADGTPKIADFGLVKLLDEDGDTTQSDAILGTPAYMAPEQARGESRLIGPAADVYALGAILYATLTGHPPFRGESRYQTLELVRTREPQPPSQHRRELSRELEAICLKCLKKVPAQRYATAEALAEDLDRYLRGERPLACADPFRRRLWVGLPQKPSKPIALACCAAALLMLISFGVFAWLRRSLQPLLPPPMVLIDHDTAPADLHWIFREQEAEVLARPPNDVFTLRSKKLSMLELCSSPPWPSYRLEAEIQDEQGEQFPRGVGIFFALHSLQSVSGPYLSFWTMGFSEHGQHSGLVELSTSRLHLVPPFGHTGLSPRCLPHRFTPVRQAPVPRRTLAVEVRDTEVRALWGNECICQVPQEQVHELSRRTLLPTVKDVVGQFTPQGGLGIFVQDGTASFHRVVLTPLR